MNPESIISPHNWNLIMFPKIHSTEVTAYADDLTIVGIGIDEKTVADNIKSDIRCLQVWGRNRRSLVFSPSKTN